MRFRAAWIAPLLLAASISVSQAPREPATSPIQAFGGPARSWLQHVRISAYPLTPENAADIVRQATESGVFGIEGDNDIPGRYESLLHPEEKLEAIRRVAEAAHRHQNKA